MTLNVIGKRTEDWECQVTYLFLFQAERRKDDRYFKSVLTAPQEAQFNVTLNFRNYTVEETKKEALIESPIEIEESWAEYFYENAATLKYKMDPPTPEQIMDSELSEYKKSFLMTKFY